MAPSQNRRLGYSRKAQYGLFFGYVVAVFGALFALLLLLASAFDRQGYGALSALMTDVTEPVVATARGAVEGVKSVGEGISAYFAAGSKNRALTAEVEANRTRLIEGAAAMQENRRLRRLLGIAEAGVEPVAAARLIASSPTSSRRYAILDAGRSRGVRSGQPVRGPDGLVGRVAAVGTSTARVTLISDGGMVVPVRRARDGLPAISTGDGQGGLDIRPLTAGDNPFEPGDILVTSGTGGIYAPNIPVAVVVRVVDDGAVGRPLAHPAALDFAIVDPVYRPQLQQMAPPREPR